MTDQQRVLITGGAGFIGSHVVDRFLERGATVAVIDDLSTGKQENLSQVDDSRLSFFQCSIESEKPSEVLSEFRPDLIVHAAAQVSVRESMHDPKNDLNINVAGTMQLLRALPEGLSPHFVFLSTGGALYGEAEEMPTPESYSIQPTSFYGLHKRFGELYFDIWAREFGLKSTVLRLANVYGPRQDPHGEAGVVAIFAERVLEEKECIIYGDGSQTRDFVSVFDVVSAIETVADEKVYGTFNIGTGKETSVNELFQSMKEISLSFIDGDEGAPFRYEAARSGEQQRSVISAEKLSGCSSWKSSVELQEGLRQTLEWFRAK